MFENLSYGVCARLLVGGFVKPSCRRQGGWDWEAVNEALGMSAVGGLEDFGAFCVTVRGKAVVDVSGRDQAESGVVMLVVVPVEEVLAVGPGALSDRLTRSPPRLPLRFTWRW